MLSKKEERRTFGNGRLRDQWEQRAQSVADQCKKEEARKEKSSLKLLFSKWNYHWLLVKGEKAKEDAITGKDEAEKPKPKIRFKIVPPPPKPKPKPPPPPPPRRTASPKPLITRRKVEVDVFRIYWRESWMSLKPPKYLFLRAKEPKAEIVGFPIIELTNSREYKPKGYELETEWTCSTDEWSQSWKQVKDPATPEPFEEKQIQWEILFVRDLLSRTEIGQTLRLGGIMETI
ncbi:titin-like [Thunnus maccoyii]|uniref:titin-like n=1 Tax=Thunnus maccoyii TaxID=8240 RepID=UPI001C4B9FB0|nr:titin-like [Thunnus maccoyii]